MKDSYFGLSITEEKYPTFSRLSILNKWDQSKMATTDLTVEPKRPPRCASRLAIKSPAAPRITLLLSLLVVPRLRAEVFIAVIERPARPHPLGLPGSSLRENEMIRLHALPND